MVRLVSPGDIIGLYIDPRRGNPVSRLRMRWGDTMARGSPPGLPDPVARLTAPDPRLHLDGPAAPAGHGGPRRYHRHHYMYLPVFQMTGTVQ